MLCEKDDFECWISKCCCISVLNELVINSRQTQLHKLHTGIHLCVFGHIWTSMCIWECSSTWNKLCLLDFYLVLFLLYFLSLFSFHFGHTVLLPPTRFYPVVLTLLPTLLIPHHVFSDFFFPSSSFCPTSSLSSSSLNSTTFLFFLARSCSDERDRNLRKQRWFDISPQPVI